MFPTFDRSDKIAFDGYSDCQENKKINNGKCQDNESADILDVEKKQQGKQDTDAENHGP